MFRVNWLLWTTCVKRIEKAHAKFYFDTIAKGAGGPLLHTSPTLFNSGHIVDESDILLGYTPIDTVAD